MRLWNMLVAAWLCWTGMYSMASGAPFRLMGYDGYAAGKANSQKVFGGGVGVLYSNPALLLDLEPQVTFSILVVQPNLEASLLKRPANADVPITLYDSDVGIEGSNLDRALPTSELPNPRSNNARDELLEFMGVGFIHSFGLDSFRLGMSLLVPISGLVSAGSHYPDEREQYFSNTVHFVRFGEWSYALSAILGVAYQPASRVSVGLSLETSLKAQATMGAYIPEATVQDYALTNTVLDGDLNMRAIVGVTVQPLDALRLSLVWRDRRYIKIESDAMITLWNFHEPGSEAVPKRVRQHHVLALDFEPMEVGLSAGIIMDGWRVEAGITWNHWSDYLDTHHKRAQETAVFEDPSQPGELLGDGDRFAFSDTFSMSAGCSLEHRPGHTLLAGLAYRPSPVSPQVGRTNYVDNDLLTMAAGYRLDFVSDTKPVRVDLGLQAWYMVPATVYKDPSLIRDEFADRAKTLVDGKPMPEAEGLQTNNPGFPGYKYGGWSLMGSISISYLF